MLMTQLRRFASRTALAAGCIALVALMFATGCGSGLGRESVRSAVSGTASTPPIAPEGSSVVDTMRRVAAELGEPDPQRIRWVRAEDTNGPARLIGGRDDILVAQPGEDIPVIVVLAEGRFDLAAAGLGDVGTPTEPQEPLQPHRYLYLTIDEATGEPTGWTVTGRLVDLSVLGEVVRA